MFHPAAGEESRRAGNEIGQNYATQAALSPFLDEAAANIPNFADFVLDDACND